MALKEIRCNFDFASNVWDELFCVVCHLVLNETAQLVKCVQRLCEVCFNQIKNYEDDNYSSSYIFCLSLVEKLLSVFYKSSKEHSVKTFNHCSINLQFWTKYLQQNKEIEQN